MASGQMHPPLPEFSVLFSRVCKSVVLRASEGGLKSTSTSPDAGKAKAILQNVSGVAKAGEILAIMVRNDTRVLRATRYFEQNRRLGSRARKKNAY